MEIQLIDLCVSYLEAAESIRKSELMSVMDLVKKLDISFVTLRRIQKDPSTCSLKTLRKFRKFVDEWQN